MKNKFLNLLLILAVLFSVIFPAFKVQAETLEFSDSYMEVTPPDNTIVLTKDTPITDEKWAEAGITDPQSEKDDFDDMGVLAIFYDPDTKTMVRLLEKQSTDSRDIFNLSLLSQEKLNEFLDSLVSSTDESTKADIAQYSHKEAIFFRYNVEITKDNTPLNELIYGTIVNGYTLTFDIYTENGTTPIDETFIKALVDNTHFTKFLDKAAVEKEERNSLIRLAISFAVIVFVIVIWIYINRKKRKKQEIQKKEKTEALTRFYTEQREKEEKNIKEPVLFINHTKYSQEVIKDFCYYNAFIRRYKFWITMVLCIVAVFFYLYVTGSSIISYTVAIVLLFVLAYFQGIRLEKIISRMLKTYDNGKNKEAVFTFYEDYYTLSGIQFISQYPYIQVTEVREYKDYIYLYMGSDKAVYLKKEGFEQDISEFKKFITQKIG